MRYIYLALASIAGALLFLLIFAEAGDAQVKQTRAQLKAERDMYADMLVDDEIQIGQLKKDLQSRDDTIQMLMDSYNTQQKRLDALEYANKLLLALYTPQKTVIVPEVEINQTVEPPRLVVMPAYQPPVWDSPVYCSGYEIPVRGGITITSQNCH